MITFFLSTYPGDEPLAHRLVGQIRQHHPGSPIVVIADGYSPELPGATVYTTQSLKRPGTTHIYSHNRLKVALESSPDSDLFIQMDPDCYLSRPFRKFPASEWFGRGSIERYGPEYTCRIILGCCWGMRRALLNRMVSENPFTPELYDYPGNIRPDGIAFEDLGFALAVDSLYPNHLWRNWGEVNIGGKIRGRAAVTHPVKEIHPELPEPRVRQHLPALRPIKYSGRKRYQYRPVSKILMKVMLEQLKAMSNPPSVLEFGSGISTRFLADALIDGHISRLDSIEHLQDYADQVFTDLHLQNTDGFCIHVLPLGADGFYDLSEFSPGIQYDVVLVDGPPANVPDIATSRQPAVEVLDAAGLIKQDTIIYLDDAHRVGEKQVISHWESLGWVLLSTIEGGPSGRMVAMSRLMTPLRLSAKQPLWADSDISVHQTELHR